jgi:chromosome partitioning protein
VPELAEHPAEVGRERRLREALAGVGEGYDFILVDTAPTRSLLTTNVLNAVPGTRAS